MMIMAEKITMLRKRSGWSQEELAEKLGVSRQAVSKWESGASLPDLDRMVKISQLFCVSTDYLLKDEIEEVTLPEGELAPESGGDYVVTLEEANAFLDLTRQLSARIAMAVALCILSPICLIQLAGVAEYKGSISEVFATCVGVSALLVLVGIGVAILLFNGMKLSPYQHIEKELLSLQYGVSGVVQRRKEADEPAYRMSLVVGVVLCILSVVPLLLTSALNLGDYISICCVNVLLALVAAAVFLFVRFGSIHSSYQKILQEEDYTKERKQINKKLAWFPSVYWTLTTAIYLAYSFATERWDFTWIVWPVAGVLFVAVYCILQAVVHGKNKVS
mgnify:FL=1